MELKEQIKLVVDEIRPQFQILGQFSFDGVGDPGEVVRCFVDVYEGYAKAKGLYMEAGGTLPEVDSVCQFAFGEVDDNELEAAYSIAKTQGFLPPPLMGRIGEFTMHMNRFFIAAQQS